MRLFRSSDSSWVDEHQIPLLHSPGDFLTVVVPEADNLNSSDLYPPDELIPEPSSGKTRVVSKSTHQYNLPSKSDSLSSQRTTISRSSSTPSLSKQPSCSHTPVTCRSAPARVYSRHRLKRHRKPLKPAEDLTEVGPIALEMTGDYQAAVATFMLQLPGVGHLPCTMCVGSALVSTRNMNLRYCFWNC